MKLILDDRRHIDAHRFTLCFIERGHGHAVMQREDGSLRGVTVAPHRYAHGDYYETIPVQEAVDCITGKIFDMLRDAEMRGYAAVYIDTHGAKVDEDLTVAVEGCVVDRYGNIMTMIQDGDTPESIQTRVLSSFPE